MQCYWTVFTDSNSADAAQRIIAQLQERADSQFCGIEFQDYEKGGHEARFWVDFGAIEWTQMVYEVVRHAQSLGHSWSIAGSIDEELSLTSTKPASEGIKMLTCWCSHLEYLGGG